MINITKLGLRKIFINNVVLHLYPNRTFNRIQIREMLNQYRLDITDMALSINSAKVNGYLLEDNSLTLTQSAKDKLITGIILYDIYLDGSKQLDDFSHCNLKQFRRIIDNNLLIQYLSSLIRNKDIELINGFYGLTQQGKVLMLRRMINLYLCFTDNVERIDIYNKFINYNRVDIDSKIDELIKMRFIEEI